MITRTDTKVEDKPLQDSGARTTFDTGAQRELAPGKGRYDLLPGIAINRVMACTGGSALNPDAIRVLAKVFERGAIKYTKTLKLNHKEALKWLCNEVFRAVQPHAIRIDLITPKNDVVSVMKNGFEKQIQLTENLNSKMQGRGIDEIQNDLNALIKKGLQIQGAEQEMRGQNDPQLSEKLDSAKTLCHGSLKSKEEGVQYVADLLKKSNRYKLIMTILGAGQEACFVVDAITVSGSLATALKAFSGQSTILKIPLPSEYLDHGDDVLLIWSGARNWEKGLPLWSFIDSGLRHLYKAVNCEIDEDHEGQALWNLICYVDTEFAIERGVIPISLRDPRPRIQNWEIELDDKDKSPTLVKVIALVHAYTGTERFEYLAQAILMLCQIIGIREGGFKESKRINIPIIHVKDIRPGFTVKDMRSYQPEKKVLPQFSKGDIVKAGGRTGKVISVDDLEASVKRGSTVTLVHKSKVKKLKSRPR